MPSAGACAMTANSPTRRRHNALLNDDSSSGGASQANEKTSAACASAIKKVKKRDLKKMEKEAKKLIAQEAFINGVTVIPHGKLLVDDDDDDGQKPAALEAASAAKVCQLLADPYDFKLCDEKESDGCLFCSKVKIIVANLEARHESGMAMLKETHQTQLLSYVQAKREEDQELLDARREELLEQASKARIEELKVRLGDAKAAAERKMEEVQTTQWKLEETIAKLEALEAEDAS